MKTALVFEAEREGYSIDQVGGAMTVGELKDILEDYDDDALFILSHDNRYTFGSIGRETYWEEDEDGKFVEQ